MVDLDKEMWENIRQEDKELAKLKKKPKRKEVENADTKSERRRKSK